MRQVALVGINGELAAFEDYFDAIASIEKYVKKNFPDQFTEIMEEFNDELLIDREGLKVSFDTIPYFA